MGEFSLLVRQELPLSTRPPEPQPARKPPASTAGPDNTGFAVFTAGGGQVLALNLSYSASFSRSMEQEKERLVDEVRVKQKTQDPATGKEEVNEENYIDVQVPTQINMVGVDGTENLYKYGKLPPQDNIEYMKEKVKIPDVEFVLPPFEGGIGGPTLARVVKINRRPIRRRR